MDLFNCQEVEKADEWDGHTPQNVIVRLRQFLTKRKVNNLPYFIYGLHCDA